ncbi:MAG: hypothetical protein Tsb004_15730 [Allomuricauda sp.]
MRKKQLITITLSIFCLANLSAQDLKAIGEKYLESYFAIDLDAVEGYLSDDIIWSDPTWAEMDPSSKPIVNKQNVIAHFKTAFDGISNIEHEVDHFFTSANIVVAEGFISYHWTSQEGKVFKFKIREVTILVFDENNKVVKHTDYGDFKTWGEQYREQLK